MDVVYVYAPVEELSSVKRTLLRYSYDEEFLQMYFKWVRVRPDYENMHDEDDRAVYERSDYTLPCIAHFKPLRVTVSPRWGNLCEVRKRRELLDDVLFMIFSAKHFEPVWKPSPRGCFTKKGGHRLPHAVFHYEILSEMTLRRVAQISAQDAIAVTRHHLGRVIWMFKEVCRDEDSINPADIIKRLMAAIVVHRFLAVADEVTGWSMDCSASRALQPHARRARNIINNACEDLDAFNIPLRPHVAILMKTQRLSDYDYSARRLIQEWRIRSALKNR